MRDVSRSLIRSILCSLVAVSSVCLAGRATALQSTPLSVTPARAGSLLYVPNGNLRYCSDGTSSASVDQTFSTGSFGGHAQGSVTTSTSGFEVHFTGTMSGAQYDGAALFAYA